MNADVILVVTCEYDPHADLVIERLTQMGERPVRLHLSDIPLSSSFGLKLDGRSCRGQIRIQNRTVPLDAIRSVWWRRPYPPRLPEGLTKNETRFVRTELAHSLRGLLQNLNCFWMSNPLDLERASIKPEQLTRASRLGLRTPKTLVTMDPDEALQFFEECGERVIFKVLSDPALGTPRYRPGKPLILTGAEEEVKMAYATLISREDLETHRATIRNLPCLFQQYIEKRFELRVTIIGRKIFVAEIDSQAHPRTSIDWRHFDTPAAMRKGELPREVAERCVAFMESYGLSFSAMDVILTPEGEHVFLENNPNGQWAFVEMKIPEFPMIQTVCDCLAGRHDALPRPQFRPLAEIG